MKDGIHPEYTKTQVTCGCGNKFTTRSTRHVGLGIPLFKAAAERCNGELTISSRLGKGTRLQATFQHSHIDRAPLGDMTGTLLALILAGQCDMHYTHRVGEREFEFDTSDIRAELGNVPLTHPAVRKTPEPPPRANPIYSRDDGPSGEIHSPQRAYSLLGSSTYYKYACGPRNYVHTLGRASPATSAHPFMNRAG